MSDKKKTKDTTKDATIDDNQKSKETVVKKEDILEIGYTLQKLKEMHEANDRVLEQLRRQQGSYVVEDSEEKPSVVDIEGLKMCDNCGKANSFPIQYAPARHMIVQPFVDIDFFTGTLKAGEHVVISKLHRNAIVLDIQLWFDTTVSDVRIGNALNDSAYLNVSGYNLLRTSVTDDGTFEGVAFTVGETTEHILLSLGHDFKGSFKVRITYNQ